MLAQARSVSASARTFNTMRFDVPTEQEDIAYYRRRIAAAEARAAEATCPSARLAHLELARLYAEQLRVLEPHPGATGTEALVPPVPVRDMAAPLQGNADGISSA